LLLRCSSLSKLTGVEGQLGSSHLILAVTAVADIRRTMTSPGSFKGDSLYLLPGTRDHQRPGATKASDESLVETAQNGGHWAYVELCNRHRESIFCIVQRITKNSHDTEDVLQDAWMRGFVHIRTFDGRAAFSTWLTRIAINCALMMLRKRRWHLETSLDDQKDSDVSVRLEMTEPSSGPEATLLRKERLLRVRQAIDGLPPSLRSVAQLRQAMGGSLKEMATLTGISIPATKSRLTRARLALRKHLEQV
jgi:RNA polymerase sigma factor (sigma-70 family)